jgi:replication factor A1
MEKILKEIQDSFEQAGVSIPAEQIEERLDKLLIKFKVPPEEAKRTVMNYFMKEYGIERDRLFPGRSTGISAVGDISSAGQWVNLRAKVIQLWDNSSEAVSQVGLIGDTTGTIKFIKWSRDNLPDLEEGGSYQLNNVVVNEWNGRFEVTLNRTSTVEALEEEVEVASVQPAEDAHISDIREAGQWVNLSARVVQLWDNSNELISQVGILGDETGTVKFIKWARDEFPDVEEGGSYRFSNLVVSEWNGRFEVALNRTSSVEPLSEDIEIGPGIFIAAMVGIQEGSGLIKRCPECNRALTKGACMDHGKVEGIYDLRIKAILDDGLRVQDVLIGRDLSEQLIGMNLDEAISLAADELDQSIILTRMREKLVGRYYRAEGSVMDRYMLAESVTAVSGPDMSVMDEILATLEAE